MGMRTLEDESCTVVLAVAVATSNDDAAAAHATVDDEDAAPVDDEDAILDCFCENSNHDDGGRSLPFIICDKAISG